MDKNTLVAAPAAGAKELKNQKAAKAKRIVAGGPTTRIFVGGYSSVLEFRALIATELKSLPLTPYLSTGCSL
jgi:hypothetical protein